MFIPVCDSIVGDGTDDGSGTSTTDKWMKGHIEITGHYDLSNCSCQIATNKFPDEYAIGGHDPQWVSNGEYLHAL